VTAIAVSGPVKRYGDFTALAGVVHQALEPGHVWLITPAA
jgi:hypothetical protein